MLFSTKIMFFIIPKVLTDKKIREKEKKSQLERHNALVGESERSN